MDAKAHQVGSSQNPYAVVRFQFVSGLIEEQTWVIDRRRRIHG